MPWGNLVFFPISGYTIYSLALIILLFGFHWLLEFKYKLVKRHAFFPFFLLVLVLIFSTQTNINLLLSLLFFLLILSSWLAIYQGEKLLGRTLNTGLLIGLGSLLDSSISLMLPLSFVAYTVFGRLNGRTFAILIVGYLTVWVNALALEYIILDSTTVYGFFLQMFHFTTPKLQVTLSTSHFVLLGAMLLFSLPEFANTLSRASVFKRQANTILMFLVAVVALLALAFGSAVFYMAILIPAIALLFVNYLQYIKRNWIKELILWLALLALVLFDLNIL
jgi:hypothetical protein